MARFIKREMPDLNKDGNPKVYYKMETYRNYDGKDFVKYMVDTSIGISASMVEAVLLQTTERLANLLGMGYTVTIDGIGTFSTKLGPCKGKEVEDLEATKGKRNAASVEVTGVNLRVDKELVKKINRSCNLERSGEQRIQKSPYTEAQRLERAKKYLEKHGQMTILAYSYIAKLSKSSAHRELHKFVKDPSSGITYTGRGPTRVFVL
ncbi:MAG: DNA-binding protein, partial [Bacteroidales bacterium]|nr:DNA-binding protein [Bacteroidales bacterium]